MDGRERWWAIVRPVFSETSELIGSRIDPSTGVIKKEYNPAHECVSGVAFGACEAELQSTNQSSTMSK